MDKKELLGCYRTKLNHIKLTYASLVLWSYPDTPQIYQQIQNAINKIEQFPDVSAFLNDDVAMRIACEELYNSAHRSAVKELFTLTKYYCHKTNQLNLLKEQEWFLFWRLLRNCWAHDMVFNFSKDEKKVLPVSWSGVCVNIEMNHTKFTHGQCSREKVRELLETALLFIENELT